MHGQNLQSLQEQLRSAATALGLPTAETDTNRAQVDPDAVVNALAHGGRAIIVGGRSSNFTDAMRRHPQLDFWDSTDPKSQDKVLPSNARVVLILRWVGHSRDATIRRQARERGVYCPTGLITSGDVRDLLQRFLDSAAAVPVPVPEVATVPTGVSTMIVPTPLSVQQTVEHGGSVSEPDAEPITPELTTTDNEEPMPKLRRLEKGELIDTVVAELDLTKTQGSEADRIFAIMKAKGVQTTLASVANAIWRAKTEGRVKTTTAPEPTPTAASERKRLKAAVAAHVKSPTTTPAPAADDLTSAIANLRRYLADIRAACDLVETDLLPKIEAGYQRYRDRQRKAEAVLSEFLE